MSNSRDASIKRMAEFLRLGAKMLDQNCPTCQNPLFQLKNSEIFCPSCQKKIVWEKQEQVSNSPETSSSQEITQTETLVDILNRQLQELGKKLTNERDNHTRKEILKSIWLIVQILMNIRKIQGT